MFLARKAKKKDFIEELGYILEYSCPSLEIPLTIVEEYYQSSEYMPKLSKGDLEKEVLLIDLRFMEIMQDLSELLKLEIVPSRMATEEIA